MNSLCMLGRPRRPFLRSIRSCRNQYCYVSLWTRSTEIMLGMAVGSESHGRNMAWKFAFIFIFILFCKKSLGTKSIYAETAQNIAVQRGKHAVLNMQNLKTFSNNSIVCRVEVINDPICLRFGSLSSYSFGCNLAKAQVSYIHSGSTISNEDCLKVKVLLFYNDGTEKEVRVDTYILAQKSGPCQHLYFIRNKKLSQY